MGVTPADTYLFPTVQGVVSGVVRRLVYHTQAVLDGDQGWMGTAGLDSGRVGGFQQHLANRCDVSRIEHVSLEVTGKDEGKGGG